MADVSLNNRRLTDLEAFALDLGNSAFQERAEELRTLAGSSALPAGRQGLQSAMNGFTPDQLLAFNLKNAWAELCGPDIASWPESLKNSLATIEAGIGLTSFENNLASAFQNLRLYDETVAALEVGMAVARKQYVAQDFSPATLIGRSKDLRYENSFIPESAARAGLSFISSPFSLVAPVMVGGLAGRAVTGLTSNAGRAIALADEAIAGAATLFGLVGEATGFVASSRGVQYVAQDFSPATSIGRTLVLRYTENDMLTETFSSTLFFGMLRASGGAGRFVAGLMPRGETGMALAKLTGHLASVFGLASTEEIQEETGGSVVARFIGPNGGPINGATTFYEKLWRALFLHGTINSVSAVINLNLRQNYSPEILCNAELLNSLFARTLQQHETVSAAGPRSKSFYLLFASDKPPSSGGRSMSSAEIAENTLKDDPVYQLLRQYSEKVRWADPERAALMIATAKRLASNDHQFGGDALFNHLERLGVALDTIGALIKQIGSHIAKHKPFDADIMKEGLRRTLSVATSGSDLVIRRPFIDFLKDHLDRLPLKLQRAIISGVFAILKDHQAYKTPWDKARRWTERSTRYYEEVKDVIDSQLAALKATPARTNALRERIYDKIIKYRDEQNLNEADNQLDTAAAFVSNLLWSELEPKEKEAADALSWTKLMYGFTDDEFGQLLQMFDERTDAKPGHNIPDEFIARAKAAVLKEHFMFFLDRHEEYPNRSSFKKGLQHKVLAAKRDILKKAAERYGNRATSYEAAILHELKRRYDEMLIYHFLPKGFVELAYSRSVAQIIAEDIPPTNWRDVMGSHLRFFDKARAFVTELFLAEVPSDERDPMILGLLDGNVSSFLKVPSKGPLENIPVSIKIALLQVFSNKLRPSKTPSHSLPGIRTFVQKATEHYRDSVLWLNRFFELGALMATRREELRTAFDRGFVKLLNGPAERISNKKKDRSSRYETGVFVWTELTEEEKAASDTVTWYQEMYAFNSDEWDAVMTDYSVRATKVTDISPVHYFTILAATLRNLLDKSESYTKKTQAKLALKHRAPVFRREIESGAVLK